MLAQTNTSLIAPPVRKLPGYGGIPPARSPTAPPHPARRHKHLNIAAVLVTLTVPGVIFTGTCWAFAFYVHYKEASSDVFVGLAGFAAVVCCAGLAFKAKQQAHRQSDPREATWYITLFWFVLAAWFFGIVLGEIIYKNGMQTYYKITSLNTYAGVNPGKWSGDQLLDTGVVFFEKGTQLDRSRSAFYKQGDTYCVAPIVPESNRTFAEAYLDVNKTTPLQLASYDFWAVGINCCGDYVNGDFECGEYSNPYATSGLRALVADDTSALYQAAVKHAELSFHIKADRPLFFYWMQDPTAQISGYQANGFKRFMLVTLTFWSLLIFVVVLQIAALLKYPS